MRSEWSWNGLPSDLSVECLDLADFLIIAEAITGIEAEALTHLPRLNTVEHALSAPNAGIGETSYYNTFADKAAAMTYQIIKGHPLVDGNKRAGYVCLLEFVRRNGREWAAPPGDGDRRDITVEVFVGVAAGRVSQDDLSTWIADCVIELE